MAQRDCYERKLPTEPHITFLGRDPHAPAVLRAWAAKRRVADPESADYADKLAGEMEVWRRANMGKWKAGR